MRRNQPKRCHSRGEISPASEDAQLLVKVHFDETPLSIPVNAPKLINVGTLLKKPNYTEGV